MDAYIARQLEVISDELCQEDPLYRAFIIKLLHFIYENSTKLGKTHSKFQSNILYDDLGKYYFFYAENGKITYFNNLNISIAALRIANLTSLFNCFNTLKSCATNLDKQYYLDDIQNYCINLLNTYYATFKADAEKGKWTEENIVKRIEECRTVTPGRFINTLKMVGGSRESFKSLYVEAKFYITSDPIEIAKAYEAGPSSCMKSSSGEARYWKNHFKDEKGNIIFHPAMFYGMYPGHKFAYLKRGNKVIARAVLLEEYKCWPKMYVATRDVEIEFIKHLEKAGYSHNNTFNFIKDELRIPGIWIEDKKDYWMPVPYTDGYFGKHYAWFDITTKEFVLIKKSPKNDREVGIGFRSTKGYLAAKDAVLTLSCFVCGNKIRGEPQIKYKNQNICSASCSIQIGLQEAETHEGEFVYIEKPAVHEKWYENKYTTENAALKRNIHAIQSLLLKEQDVAVPLYCITNLYELININNLTNKDLIYSWPYHLNDNFFVAEINKKGIFIIRSVVDILFNIEKKIDKRLITGDLSKTFKSPHAEFFIKLQNTISNRIFTIDLPDLETVPNPEYDQIDW